VTDDYGLLRIRTMTSFQITTYRFRSRSDIGECEFIGDDGSPARSSKAYGHSWKSKVNLEKKNFPSDSFINDALLMDIAL
jgi:hypothetical protein